MSLAAGEVEGLLRDLAREGEDDLVALLRKAYELGYREALVARGGRAAVAAPVVVAPVALAAPAEAPAPAEPLFAGDEDDDEDDDAAGAGSEPGAEARPRRARPVGVRASTTIGGLVERIEWRYRLERFDIDVVICRKGDPDRRRLKGSTALRAYVVEEE